MKKQHLPIRSQNVYRIHYPYCIKMQPDGKYLVLNRDYAPLGFMPRETGIDLSKVAYNLEITPKIAGLLSVSASQNIESIYLYNDATDPINGDDSLTNYMERLAIFLTLRCW